MRTGAGPLPAASPFPLSRTLPSAGLANAFAPPPQAGTSRRGPPWGAPLPLRTDAPDPPARKRRRKFSPLVVAANRLAKLLDGSVRSIRTWDAAGKLPAPIRIGGRVVWRVQEIRAWLEAGAPNRDEWEARKSLSRK